jgi:hypothetical protein
MAEHLGVCFEKKQKTDLWKSKNCLKY